MNVADLLLIGEDKAHAVLLGVLLRGVLCEEDTKLEPKQRWLADNAKNIAIFLGEEDLNHIVEGLRYTSSGQKLAAPEGPGPKPKLRGHIGGKPLGPEAAKWRSFLVTILMREPRPDAILIAKDTDGDPRGLGGLRQVIDHLIAQGSETRFAMAAPHQDAECWFVAGFEPRSDEARARHRALCQELSFDPLQQPERLTAHPNDAKTDAKRVLRILLGFEAESRPLDPGEMGEHHEALLGDLPRLRRQGASCGVPEFLLDLSRQIIPLWLDSRD